MSILDEILEHNRRFVATEAYRDYVTAKYPHKKMVVLTCMDTRLMELVPRAMNLRHGDVKIVRNAGAIVSHPFGSIMRSILIAIYQLGARVVCVVGHHDCGMTGLRPETVLERARDMGVPDQTIETLVHAGIDLNRWLTGFHDVPESVKQSVDLIKHHPLLPPGIAVHGLVIHSETGKLDVVVVDPMEAGETRPAEQRANYPTGG